MEVSGGLLRRGEGEPPVARLSLDLMAIPLRPVLSRLMPLDLQATGGLSGEVSGTLRSGHPLEEISGELRVETGPGRLSGIETLAPLEPEFAQDGVVFFDRLEGEFALTEQGILLRDFTLVRGDLSARVTALLDRETRRLRGAVEIRDAAGDVRRLPLGD